LNPVAHGAGFHSDPGCPSHGCLTARQRRWYPTPAWKQGKPPVTDSIQLLGISNAIVDILAHVDEEFLAGIGVPRGSMTLIDEQRAKEIYDRMGPATEMSGGSVANTIANFASLGGRA